jgi:hypothetical protein
VNCKEEALKKIAWEELKNRGSEHYKTGEVEPIDLYRCIPIHGLHPSLTLLDAKALTDTIKYAYRMLTKGANKSDCEKISHYIDMVKWGINAD